MIPRLAIAGMLCIAVSFLTCVDPSGSDDDTITVADSYEPDDSRSTASQIDPDSGSQSRTLKHSDTDWVSFSAVSGTSYKIYTKGQTDTRIKVYSSSGSTPIVEGDDSPNDINAQVVFNCTQNGTYYIKVYGNNPTVSGPYDLSVVSSIGPDSYEPDSLPGGAKTLSTGSTQTRSITKDDVDWIRCSLTSGDSVLFTAKGTFPVTITLYDRDTTSKLVTASPDDSSAELRYRVSASGTYFVRISGQKSTQSGSYRLTMQTSSSGTLVTTDAYEDDNTRSTAKRLPGNSVVQQRSFSPGDTDWVMLPVVEGRQYTLSFSGTYTIRANMFTKDGTKLLGPSSSLFLNSSATDTVYAQMYSTTSTPFSYTLTVTVMMQPTIADAFEDDDTRETATFAPGDSFIQDRTLAPQDSKADTDWVAFPVMAAKQYTIKATKSSSTTFYMYLYSQGSSSYLTYTSSSSSTISYTPTQPDTMYLRIYSSYSSAGLAYTLSVSGRFNDDSFEPDSSRAIAKELSTSSQSRIILPGDTDWVKYTAKPDDSIMVQTTGNTDTKIALFSSSGATPIAECDDIDSGNTNAMVAWKSDLGGQFYLCITGQTSSVTGAYQLRAYSVSSGTLLVPDSLEDDNSKSTARIITDTVFSGEVHSLHANDTDWVAFPAMAGGQYTVSVSSSSNSLYLYGYTSGDSLVGSRTGITSGSITYVPKSDDTLYCRITSQSTVQRYTVSLSRIAAPTPDAFEDDNTRSQARLITDSILSGEVHSLTVGDTDWVAFPAQAGGQYTVKVSSSSNTVNVQAYTASNSLFATRSSTTSASIVRSTPSVDTLYYQITSLTSVQRYTISMTSITPYPADAYEVDNQRSLAQPIVADSVQSHTLAMSDSDWVTIALEAGGIYQITTAATFTHYVFCYLGSSSSYSYSKSGSSTVTRFVAPDTGRLDILVRQYSASTSYVGPYTIVVSKSVEVPTKAVAAGGTHTMILKTDGTLWGTGSNTYGQLGDKTTSSKTTPVQVATEVAAVAAGYQYSMFIKTDGTLWAMGYNSYYQLGTGSSSSKSTPVQIMTGAAAVSCGYRHTLVVKTDGSAWAFGYNSYGQLGDGTTSSRSSAVKIMDSVVSVAAGYQHSLFVKNDGTLWASGWNSYNQISDTSLSTLSTPVLIMDSVVSATGGYYHTFALKSDNSLWGIGTNSYGELGSGTTSKISVPKKIMTGVLSVSAGYHYSLVVKSDSTLWVTGQSSYGQLGTGSTATVLIPVQITTGVAAVSLPPSSSYSIFIKGDGSLWGTGLNSSGQLGDGTSTNKSTAVRIIF